MRVLHVIPNYPPAASYGGPIGSTHALCRHLAAEGTDVVVFTTDVDGPRHMPVATGDPTTLDGVTVHYYRGLPRVGYGLSFEMASALLQHVATFDIVHIHTVFTASTTFASWACQVRDVPYLVSTRGMLTQWAVKEKSAKKALFLRAFESRNLRCAAALHATSDDEAEDLRRLGFTRVVVVPNAVERPPIIPPSGLRRTLGLQPDRRLAVYLGRLSPEKGVDIAIAATAGCPGIDLVVVGDGPADYVRQLRHQVVASGAEARVHFVGWLDGDEKWSALAAADVVLAPSRTESYGMSIAEALTAGSPVAVSDATPWRDVEDEGAGFVTPGTPAAFGAVLAQVSALGSERLAAMRSAARRVAARHRWENRAQQLIQIYRQLADEHHARDARI